MGLGKTIQAGLLLRQAWLSGRAQRILVLAPKAVLGQWQIELSREVQPPLAHLRRPPPRPVSLAGVARAASDRGGPEPAGTREPAVIASSHLMRRRDRAKGLLEDAAPWDLVILDEAHHARRRAAGAAQEGGPNALLRLMRGLAGRARGLVLLTATPMQVHPVEVWDLLHLLGLPPEWSADAFLRFFEDLEQPSPSSQALDRMAGLFRAVERSWGEVATEDAQRLTALSRFKANKVLRALRDPASIPRRQLETEERRAALRIVQAHTPIRRLVSRHTRALLRRYFKAGTLTTPIAERSVDDRFIDMSGEERALYDAVEEYIASTWNQAGAAERTAVGFVMTIYRRRLASSFHALRATLRKHLDAIAEEGRGRPAGPGPQSDGRDADAIGIAGDDRGRLAGSEEDAPDDETMDDMPDADEIAALERRALAAEEAQDVERLLDGIGRLPPDSKLDCLKHVLGELNEAGFAQTMVFTQFTDTMDFLREALRGEAAQTPCGETGPQAPLGGTGSQALRGETKPQTLRGGAGPRLMCFSGRGGEIPAPGGGWRRIGRDEAKRPLPRGGSRCPALHGRRRRGPGTSSSAARS